MLIAAEDRLDLLRLGRLLLELFADHVDLELRESIQLQLEDRVRLDLVELEPLDDLVGRVFLAFARADDLDDLVEGIEDRDVALEDVDPLVELLELIFEPALRDDQPEVEEVLQHRLDAEAARLRRRAERRAPSSRNSGGTRHVMLTWKFDCSGVFLNKYAITSSGSASFLISRTMRMSSVDSSRTSTQVRQLARR